MSSTRKNSPIAGLLDTPATIVKNNFVFKSLSVWSLNIFIGCLHGCRFCYVTDTSIAKVAGLIRSYGVDDPVRDWGSYLLVRPWDRGRFLASLRKAEETPAEDLTADGNRAVMLCSTTDAYQVVRHADPAMRDLLQSQARHVRREALELIRDESTLNVRILTRSPLAREDFDIFETFGDRLLLGTSLPTLDHQLAKVYEPKVPAPRQRLKLLLDARDAGIHTFVAVAPVFPECGYEDLVGLFEEVGKARPVTIFMEPVNLRLDIARRIGEEAAKLGREIDMAPYTDRDAWSDYAVAKLREAGRAAAEAGVADRLHLWPDKALGAKKVVARQADPEAYTRWLQRWWGRVSEWPGKAPVTDPVPESRRVGVSAAIPTRAADREPDINLPAASVAGTVKNKKK